MKELLYSDRQFTLHMVGINLRHPLKPHFNPHPFCLEFDSVEHGEVNAGYGSGGWVAIVLVLFTVVVADAVGKWKSWLWKSKHCVPVATKV